MTTLLGGCLCGAVRYECSGEPAMSALCYCTDCQHATGGAFSAGFMVAKESFKLLKGELKSHEVTADSGNKVSRNFCPTCGSPVMNQFTAMPTLVEVAAGSLDDVIRFKPNDQHLHVQCSALGSDSGRHTTIPKDARVTSACKMSSGTPTHRGTEKCAR